MGGGGNLTFPSLKSVDRPERTDAAVGGIPALNGVPLKVQTPLRLRLGNPHIFLRWQVSSFTMPSAFTDQLVAQYGVAGNYRYSDARQINKATTIAGEDFKLVQRMQPWENTRAKGILEHHPVAWWSDLTVTIQALPGVYGRMCTFYGGWSSAGAPPPKSVGDILQLHAGFAQTWGGTGDPGTATKVIPCPFNDTMTDTLKTPYNEGVRAVFYYCFLEVPLIDKVQDSERFLIHFHGTFNVQGKY